MVSIILEPVETILEMVMTNLWLIDISLKLVGTIMELAVTSCECFSQKKTQSLNVHLPTHIFSSHHYLCLRFFFNLQLRGAHEFNIISTSWIEFGSRHLLFFLCDFYLKYGATMDTIWI